MAEHPSRYAPGTRPRPVVEGTERAPDRSAVTWPESARMAVALTFDFYGGEATVGDATSVSRQAYTITTLQFGPRRGIWHILELLREHGTRATFNVCGITAETYPEAVAAIVADGHELGALGYRYEPTWRLGQPDEQLVIDRAFEALEMVTGVVPRGWRTPEGRPSKHILSHLVDRGVTWDATLRNDEIPYLMTVGRGSIVEIPGGGSTDDMSYFWFPNPATPAPLVGAAWSSEFDVLYAESRRRATMVSYTMRPCYWGRPAELAELDKLLAKGRDLADVTFMTCGEIADWWNAHDGWTGASDA